MRKKKGRYALAVVLAVLLVLGAAVAATVRTASPEGHKRSREAALLTDYLRECYGDVILSGQYADSADAPEIRAIYEQTGKYPAILGLDFLYYGKTAGENLAEKQEDLVQNAIDWWQKGGLVTFCWHWLAPRDNRLTGELPWNKSFYTEATAFDLQAAMSGEDPEGYALLLEDIDTVAEQLKVLRQAGVPVLWRPLHEASGGWFWWGNAGPDAYKALWGLLHDRMENRHGLDNLIWVWNGEDAAWYPGDETVDMIGEDIYTEPYDYGSGAARFRAAQAYADGEKMIALSETGVVPDPDELVRDGALWSWFCTWKGEFVVDMQAGYEAGVYSGAYTSADMLRKAYDHRRVITLEELPRWVGGE